jgi:hypothetical protein
VVGAIRLEGRLITFSRPRLVLLCAILAAAFSSFASTGSAAAAGTIKGEVVNVATKAAIEEVEVCAYQLPEEKLFFCAETEVDGEYALSSVPDGKYTVEFWAPYLGYVTQFYDGASTLANADEVVVSGGTVSGVDAEMEEGGEIEGRVTDAVTGAGIGKIQACALVFGVGAECGITSSSGDYRISGLATGSYLVAFLDEFQGYEALFYNQQANLGMANPVGVTAPGTTTGINARMSKPGSRVTPPPVVVPGPSAVTPARVTPNAKKVKCHRGFKKAKRHGRTVCVQKHKKKRRS